MSNVDISGEGLLGLDYDSRGYLQSHSWPVTVDQHAHPHPHPHSHHAHSHSQPLPHPHHQPHHHNHHQSQYARVPRDLSPLQTSGHAYDPAVAATAHDPLLVDWQFQQLPPHLQYSPPRQPQQAPPQEETPFTTATASYGMPIQSSPVDLMSQSQMSTGLLDGSYLSLSAPVDTMVPFAYQDLQSDLMAFPSANGLPDMSPYAAPPNVIDSSSPADTYLEVRSLGSSSSDNGWNTIERRPNDFFSEGFFINPTQTLHDRSLSESSSYSTSYGSFVDISNPINSPISETNLESPLIPMTPRVSFDHTSHGSQSPTAVSPVAVVRPMPVPKSTSPTRSAHSHSSSSSSSASPPSRKPSRKSPIAAKTNETRVRKHSQSGKPDSERRVGKRKGPLKPDQRKQASEIRKLRACLRCRFLKKTVRCLTQWICINDKLTRWEKSVTRVSPVPVASPRMLGSGKCHALGLISRRSVTS